MANIGELVAIVGADVKDLKKGLKEASKEIEKFNKKNDKATDKAAISWKKVGSAIGAGLIAKFVLDTSVTFQKLNASLVTVTGSTKAANATFLQLQEFSKKTPFQIQEVTAAFIKMKALGLNPTEESLTSFGNTASAMGKSLDQFVEATADAVVGEFERLKEFGIKARSEGDNVALTFKGVTKTIGKNAAEIQAYLIDLGETEFAGAMDRQMETLGGAMSNAQDSVTKLAAAIGEVLSPTMIEVANAVAIAADQLRALINPNIQDDINTLTQELVGLTDQLIEAEDPWVGNEVLAESYRKKIAEVEAELAKLTETQAEQQASSGLGVAGDTGVGAAPAEEGGTLTGAPLFEGLSLGFGTEETPEVGFGLSLLGTPEESIAEKMGVINSSVAEMNASLLEQQSFLETEIIASEERIADNKKDLWQRTGRSLVAASKSTSKALGNDAKGLQKTLDSTAAGISLAQAVIGATNALKLPFPENIAAFTATLAQGTSAIAMLGGGGGGGGGRAAAAPPVSSLDPTGGVDSTDVGGGQAQASTVIVQVDGDIVDVDGYVENKLAPAVQDAVNRGVDFNLQIKEGN
jgi:hypothetical protein